MHLIKRAHDRELNAKQEQEVSETPKSNNPYYYWRLTSGFVEELKDANLPGTDKIVRACSWLFMNYYNISNPTERIMIRHWYAMDQTFNAGIYAYPIAFLSVMIRHYEIMSLAKLSTRPSIKASAPKEEPPTEKKEEQPEASIHPVISKEEEQQPTVAEEKQERETIVSNNK